MGQRIDFAELKQRVSLEAVLLRYGTRLHKSGKSLRGGCPIDCGEDGGKNCFDVNPVKGGGVWKCFHRGCGARRQGGDVLDLVKAIEGVSLREAGGRLADWFAVGEKALTETAKANGDSKPKGPTNPPLGFRLQVDLEAAREYLEKRGFKWSAAEVESRGMGVAARGMFAGRLAVALNNEQGQLIGYAGRAVDESEPCWLFPSAEKNFRKTEVLYNLDGALRAQIELQAPRDVVLVEGVFDCWKVAAALGEDGCQCVALLGSSLSTWQEEKLAEWFQRVVLLFDGDEAGRKCTEDCLQRLGRKVWVQGIELAEGQQPDQLVEGELRGLLEPVLER